MLKVKIIGGDFTNIYLIDLKRPGYWQDMWDMNNWIEINTISISSIRFQLLIYY